jgi:hypothetical protein
MLSLGHVEHTLFKKARIALARKIGGSGFFEPRDHQACQRLGALTGLQWAPVSLGGSTYYETRAGSMHPDALENALNNVFYGEDAWNRFFRTNERGGVHISPLTYRLAGTDPKASLQSFRAALKSELKIDKPPAREPKAAATPKRMPLAGLAIAGA